MPVACSSSSMAPCDSVNSTPRHSHGPSKPGSTGVPTPTYDQTPKYEPGYRRQPPSPSGTPTKHADTNVSAPERTADVPSRLSNRRYDRAAAKSQQQLLDRRLQRQQQQQQQKGRSSSGQPRDSAAEARQLGSAPLGFRTPSPQPAGTFRQLERKLVAGERKLWKGSH